VLKSEQLDPAHARMIGDRAEDIMGGRANGTGTIGVLWGYGSEEELMKAEPDIIVKSMARLSAYVEAAQQGAAAHGALPRR
jgi:phosphoglycolate phosphatase